MSFTTEIIFTQTYREYQHAHPALREAMCLRAQFPAFFRPIQDGDLLAGRIEYGAVGFSPQEGGIGLGYYCQADRIERALRQDDLSAEERAQLQHMLDFWRTETTAFKVRAAFTPELQRWLPTDDGNVPGIGYPLYRMTGGYLDFDKLVRLGIPGLRAEIAGAASRVDAPVLYEAMNMALDLLAEVCLWYAGQATDPAMAAALTNISRAKPATFREGAQLAWLYAIISGHRNYGRLDEYLGDLYATDLAAGRTTEAQALAVLQSMWRLIAARKLMFDGRVVVGGVGRRNPANADAVALLAMEATRTVLEITPQLTLRFHKDQDPRLMAKALTVIGEGRTFPMLYNDDVNVPAVMNAFRVSREEAEQYMPFSCGEYVLNHRSYGSPNGLINLVQALTAALHNGRGPLAGAAIGLETGNVSGFTSFEQLWNAYRQQAEHFVRLLADQQAIENRVAGEAGPFLFTSMLYDDCIGRGKGVFAGGIRYLGGTLETYGNVNTADSLTAIKTLVFDRQAISLERLVAALDANFEGFAPEHRLLKNAPKYGNDDPVADAMAAAVHEHICGTIRDQAERTDMHSYLAVLINNSGNTVLGKLTPASADGRMARAPLANANNPSGGSDRKGVTAMLNSLVKLTPTIHAGAVQNMKFSRELFTTRREQLEALLDTYWENGGTQAMITVVSRGDLENALKEPEKYHHIFVRVGGFTARFVRMDPDVQAEVLSRTLY